MPDMFWIASWIRFYLMQFANWLLMSAFAIDQLSEVLLEAAKRQCQRWLPVYRIYVDKKGHILKIEVRKHGL